VDLEVAKVACAAAESMRLKRGSPKPILVEAVRDLLSPETINRPKKGFTLPFETWMRNEMFAEVDSVLRGIKLESVGLDSSAVSQVWSQFQSRRPGVNWSRPWALYTLVRWAAQNGLAEAPRNLESVRGAMTLSAAG
jgi:asparagine synthase (glutamine-hydrolysing)